ncbi:MAG: enoyl-CoA hydratase/isomerase family protein [Acidobacteria bacterium]|nr:enoyl-CoA hydratase/isomerase family protein [Acidobacteriota bacterium]
MVRDIQKAGVLGAGVMGAAIAAHLVNAGIDVVLLDLEIEKGGQKIHLAREAVKAMAKAKPSPIFVNDWLQKIKTGTFSSDLKQLEDCDWVIEVVKEDLTVKHNLFKQIAGHLRADALLTTNTSGIPIAQLSEVLPSDLKPRFCGTHFFNPPRYMKLLEVIAGPETSQDVLSFFEQFGESRLGKGVVFAKDCPNFIANRIGVLAMMGVMQSMLEDKYTIEEVDKLMGPLTGRPKSAVFNTADVVGLDTFAHVSDNLYQAAVDDEMRDQFVLPHPIRAMIEKGYLGRKSGSGFYQKTKGEKSEILTIDLDTLTYRPKQKPNFPAVEVVKNEEDLAERLRKLVALNDRAGTFIWKALSTTLVYAVNRLGEVADDIVNVDRAVRWGFNWEMGPFETWDALGVSATAERLRSEGRPVPALVEKMLEKGVTSFYQSEKGVQRYMDIETLTYTDVPGRPNVLILADYKQGDHRVVKQTPGASLLDLGDGVACLEFHSKMNAIGSDTISMTQYAVKTVEEKFDALVVANQGGNFSAGANLMLLLMEAQEGNFEDINLMIAAFQKATSSLRYCKKPVVVAPYGLTLGGGCEFTLHGDGVEAAAETYMGLVEVGVGLIPAGGGTKEMLLRHVGGAAARGESDLLTPLRRIFETIGMGKVATSAEEARQFGFLKPTDGVTMNGDALVTAAKKRARAMADMGYQPPSVPDNIPVLGEPAYAALKLGLYMMREGGYISEHDAKIGTHLARILTGGALTPGTTMTEQHVLDLEREAFLRLCGERKSLERIHHMLTKGKPLRN